LPGFARAAMEVPRRSLKELSQQRKRRGKAARRRNLCTTHVGPKVCFLARISAGCASGEGRVRPTNPLNSLPETCRSSWAAIQLTFV